MSSASDDVILKGVWWGERREEERSRAVDFTWLLFLIIKKLQRGIDGMGWEEVMVLGVHQSRYLFDTQHS